MQQLPARLLPTSNLITPEHKKCYKKKYNNVLKKNTIKNLNYIINKLQDLWNQHIKTQNRYINNTKHKN